MANRMWTITEDKIGDDNQGVGVVGPKGTTLSHNAIKNHPERKAFKMYDDDGNHCYSGFYVGPDDESLFAPLDDYGKPNAGCTEIRYREPDGTYKQL